MKKCPIPEKRLPPRTSKPSIAKYFKNIFVPKPRSAS
jgi:hypothetical protein